mgnify:CR=1 FL=1
MAVKSDLILVAGGKGMRMGHHRNKIFMEVSGQSIASLTLQRMTSFNMFDRIIISAQPVDITELQQLDAVSENPSKIIFVEGGETRSQSVRNAMMALRNFGFNEYIFVHDIVRPLISKHLMERLLKKACSCSAVAPAITPTETVRQKNEQDAFHSIDRDNVYLMQTPQVISSELINTFFLNHESENLSLSDEMAFLERKGEPFKIIQGDPMNIKVTHREDILRCEFFLAQLKQTKKSDHS